MRTGFLSPEGELTGALVRDILALAGAEVAPGVIAQWSQQELALAYDWAAREHLRASDNTSVRRREKPWLVRIAESGRERAALRDIIASYGQFGISVRRLSEEAAARGLDPGQVPEWLELDAAAGLVVHAGFGRWVSLPGEART